MEEEEGLERALMSADEALLGDATRRLAQSEESRARFRSLMGRKPELVRAASLRWEQAVLQGEGIRTAALVARILRNGAVGDKGAQKCCFDVASSAVTTLWKTTAYSLENDEDARLLSRTLVQLLSNLVTGNDDLQNSLWNDVLDVGKTRQGTTRDGVDIVIRLLQSPDQGTSAAAQVLVLNATIDSPERCESLARGSAGASLMRCLLDLAQSNVEADEDDEDHNNTTEEQMINDNDSGLAFSLEDAVTKRRRLRLEGLGVLFAIFDNVIERGFFDDAYRSLAPFNEEHSLVSPPQLTLLKILDAKLQQRASHLASSSEKTKIDDLQSLSEAFSKLAIWAQASMQDVLDAEAADAKPDARLVEVHTGLVLLCQCLIQLCMSIVSTSAPSAAQAILRLMRTQNFVGTLISLLHTTMEFSPAISPFKSTAATPISAPPQGHALSHTGATSLAEASARGQGGAPAASKPHAQKRPGMDNLKRDLVSLLGTLAFYRSLSTAADKDEENNAVRVVQDTTREKGGLFDVMNLTQLDERNPYIRERAIFALRSLLRNNEESQSLVARLRPVEPNGSSSSSTG